MSRKICSRKAEILFKKKFPLWLPWCVPTRVHLISAGLWEAPWAPNLIPQGSPTSAPAVWKKWSWTRINSPNGKHKCTLVGKKLSAERRRWFLEQLQQTIKKFQFSLKKSEVNSISGIEEVKMFTNQGSVIHLNNPRG